MKRVLVLIGAALLAVTLAPTAAQAAAPKVPATFEGKVIDLADADGWGPAHACSFGPTGTVCFRTEGELNQFLTQTVQTARALVGAVLSTCATPTRVYANASYGGNVVALSTRGKWVDLSSYGFDNQTSSYRIGTCKATLADGKAGAGSHYPGNTNAGASAASMASGWNDRVSSVYLA